MKIKIISVHNVDWTDREWECYAQTADGEHGQYGYGDTPLQAARRAWRGVRYQIKQAVIKELCDEH